MNIAYYNRYQTMRQIENEQICRIIHFFFSVHDFPVAISVLAAQGQPGWLSATQFVNQLDQRQEHGNNNSTDNDSQKDNHNRFYE